MFLKKAMDGDKGILVAVFRKVFPDNLNIGGNETNPLRLLSDEELEERVNMLQKTLAGLRQ